MREAKRHTPIRTCVGCRTRDERHHLLRLVLGPDGQVAPDVVGRLPGRGASVHPRPSCLDAALKRGGLSRAFRTPVRQSPEELRELVSTQYRRRAEGLLLAARRAGHLAFGTDMVRDHMRRGEVELLLVASDAANRRQELESLAERIGARCVVFSTRAALGHLLGRDAVGVIGILDANISEELSSAAARVSALSEVA